METPFLYDGRMAYQRPNISDVGLEVGSAFPRGTSRELFGLRFGALS